jgi:SAM-dependent methyltransferase
MFNNWVNLQDFTELIQRIRSEPRMLQRILARFRIDRSEHVKAAWRNLQVPPKNWWDIPAVRERWNLMISGDRNVDYYEYVDRKYLAGRDSLRGLSLGCGNGQRELRWAKLGKFSRIDAFDISKEHVEFAIAAAKEKGYDRIVDYRVADVNSIEMREDYYDVVLVEQSLHHFSPLELILQRVNSFLEPDGYLVVNEFVGPPRFQWTNRQMQATNGLLAILPAQYRTRWNSMAVKTFAYKPGLLRMFLSDPSEAIESSHILPLLRKLFDVVEVKGFGGNILHLLFDGIAHHFSSPDAEAQNWLKLCFEIEDQFLASDKCQSDFVIAICRKRSG